MAVTETLKVTSDVHDAIKGITLIGNAMNNLYKTAIAVSVAFAGIQIVRNTYESISRAETAIIKLKTALQSATAGVNDYEKAMKFAAKTPFPVESVIEASVALRAFQIDPFKEVKDSGKTVLEILGDMAGAMGQDIVHATLAFTKAGQAEWEIMDNNYQLRARMIPQLAGLQAGTDKYRKTILEFLATQDRFKDGMRNMAVSLKGMMSNLSDAFDLLLLGIGGVADSEARLKGLTLYDSIRENVKKLYEAVSNDAPFDEYTSNLEQLLLKNKKLDISFEGVSKRIEEVEADLRKMYLAPIDNSKQIKSAEVELKLLKQRRDLLKTDVGKRQEFYQVAKDKSGARNKDEIVNYLLSVNRAAEEQQTIAEDFMSQGDKIMQLGRIIGQFTKLIFDTFFDPIFTAFKNLTEYILNLPQKFLSFIVPFNSFGKDIFKTFTTSQEELNKSVEDSTYRIGDQIYSISENLYKHFQKYAKDSFVSIKEFQELSSMYIQTVSNRDKDAIEMRLLSSKNAMEKQMIIFAILMKIIGEVIKDQLKKVYAFFEPIFDKIYEGGQRVFIAFAKIFKTIFEIFLNIIKGFSNYLYDIREGVITFIDTITKFIESRGTLFVYIVNQIKDVFYLVGQVLGIIVKYTIKIFNNIIDILIPLYLFKERLLTAFVILKNIVKYGVLLYLGLLGITILIDLFGAKFLHILKIIHRTNILTTIGLYLQRAKNILLEKQKQLTEYLLAQQEFMKKNFKILTDFIGKMNMKMAIGLGIIAALVVAIYMNWDKVSNALEVVSLWLSKFIDDVINLRIHALALLTVIVGIATALGAIKWATIWGAILPILTTIKTIGATIISTFLIPLAKIIGIAVVSYYVFKGVLEEIFNLFGEIFEVVSELVGEFNDIGGLIELFDLSSILSNSFEFRDIWNYIKNLFSEFLEVLVDVGRFVGKFIVLPFMIIVKTIQFIVRLFREDLYSAMEPLHDIGIFLVSIFLKLKDIVIKIANIITGGFFDLKSNSAEQLKGLEDYKKQYQQHREEKYKVSEQKTMANEYRKIKDMTIEDKKQYEISKLQEKYEKRVEGEAMGKLSKQDLELKKKEILNSEKFMKEKEKIELKYALKGAKQEEKKKEKVIEEFEGVRMPLRPKLEVEPDKLGTPESLNMEKFNYAKLNIEKLDSKLYDKKEFQSQKELAENLQKEKIAFEQKQYKELIDLTKNVDRNTKDFTTMFRKTFIPVEQTPAKAIGDWNVERDMFAKIHQGEMIVPRKEATILRQLAGIEKGDMTSTTLLDKLYDLESTSKNNNVGNKTVNITINQNFYSKTDEKTAQVIKKSSLDLANELLIKGL